ncbi:hypothetical protein A9Q83_05495 [Alphaproteobacteria bacterium 46_93_T64]|nr:hypothetical protein A9Q83_05495 [Alphaproteobacteria bacterium 46_93_T64]
MNEPHISLPMYDWPELQCHTDQFHALLKASLGDRGFNASNRLERDRENFDIWQDKHLLMSQTCGLPFVKFLKEKVSLIGTPAYDIECGAGSYYSVIVVHKDASASSMDDLKGKKYAYNENTSQSGYYALQYTLSLMENAATHFGASCKSGSHRQSIQAVASGKADFAAIDAISWKHATRHEAESRHLRVIGKTPPTPGLPYITRPRSANECDTLHMAVIDAMMALNETTRDALLLTGFAKTNLIDYRVIEERMQCVQQEFGPMS